MQVDLRTYKKTGLFDALHILYISGIFHLKVQNIGEDYYTESSISDLKKLILKTALMIVCTI